MGHLPSREAQETAWKTMPVVVYFPTHRKAKTTLLPARHNAPFNLRRHGAFGGDIVHDGGGYQGPITGIDQRFAFTQATVSIAALGHIVIGGHSIGSARLQWPPMTICPRAAMDT